MVCVDLPHDATAIVGVKPSAVVMTELQIVRSVVGTMKDVDEALVFIARDLMHVSDTKQMLEVALNAANVETIARSNQRNAG